MKDHTDRFPLPLIGVAVVVSPGIVLLEYPRIVYADLAAMAAGQSLVLVAVAYAAYAFSRRMNTTALALERTEKARRVAWLTFAIATVVLSAPYISRLV